MSTYIVQAGETIGDVVMNATGNYNNWDAVLTANGFTDWTPDLVPGQIIQIPDAIVNVDANNLAQLRKYPAANNIFGNAYNLIESIFAELFGNWILRTGFWADSGYWIDGAFWID